MLTIFRTEVHRVKINKHLTTKILWGATVWNSQS